MRRLAPQADPVGALAVLEGGATAAAAYFHADHMSAPAPLLLWDLETGQSRSLTSTYTLSATGLTRDRRLLLASVDGRTLVVSTLE